MVVRALDGVGGALRGVSHVLALAVGWVLILLSATIVVEVVGRKLFAMSLQGVDEYGGYILAIGSAVGFSLALFHKAHIRIDIVIRYLPPPVRAVADLVALAVLAFVASEVTMTAVGVATQSHAMQAQAVSPLRTPLEIPQGLWAAALALFALSVIVVFLRTAVAVAQRDWATVEREAGLADIEEEVAGEVESAKRRLAYGEGTA